MRLAAFAVAAAAVFAGAAGIGAVAGPLDVETTSEQMADHDAGAGSDHTEDAEHGAEAGSNGHGTGKPELPGGLMVAQDGYTLDLEKAKRPASANAAVQFRVIGPNGKPVTAYTKAHGKDLHLIAVRRDTTGYQHVHPRLGSGGQWTTNLDLSAAGEYRLFADFVPEGDDGLTLGTDLSVSGTYEPQPLPEPTRSVHVDGYTVSLDGTLTPGKSSLLTLSVSKDGEPVTDLQPYLEAYGHLVALRDGDLAYLHVHPGGVPGDGETEPGPEIRFYAEVPSAGTYRLFLDFKHEGEVRTADFTVHAGHAGEVGPDVGSDHDEAADTHGH